MCTQLLGNDPEVCIVGARLGARVGANVGCVVGTGLGAGVGMAVGITQLAVTPVAKLSLVRASPVNEAQR